jgi:hypothetical protein
MYMLQLGFELDGGSRQGRYEELGSATTFKMIHGTVLAGCEGSQEGPQETRGKNVTTRANRRDHCSINESGRTNYVDMRVRRNSGELGYKQEPFVEMTVRCHQ